MIPLLIAWGVLILAIISRVFLDPLLSGDQAPTEDQADAEERARLAAIAMWMH